MNSEIGGELAEPELFEVRAHHMWSLLGYDSVKSGTYGDLAVRSSVLVSDEYAGRTYHVDFFGTSMEERKRAQTGMNKFLSAFWELEPGDKVSFVSFRKDGICKSCIFGEHCENGLDDDSDEHNVAFSNDTDAFNRFIKAADKLKLQDKYVTRIEPTELQSGRVIQSQVVETTAKVARKVLRSRQFQISTFDFASDEERKTAEKNWRAERRRSVRETFWDNSEYRRLSMFHQLIKVRPLIGAYCLYAAGSAVFNVGETAQAVHDGHQAVHHHEKSAALATANKNFGDTGKDVLEVAVSGLFYAAIPRRWRLGNRLDEIREQREATKASQATVSADK